MDKSGDNLINNLKILIVEDDLVSETYITRVVKIFSKEILVVRNGVEGVKTCHDNLFFHGFSPERA